MQELSIAAQVHQEVASWPGVTVQSYTHGMLFFHVGRREIGHLHGNKLADLPFPVRIRERLVADGKASLHYLHPGTGWITYYIRGEYDINPIIELFRLNYDRPWLESEAKAVVSSGKTASSSPRPPTTPSTATDSEKPSKSADV